MCSKVAWRWPWGLGDNGEPDLDHLGGEPRGRGAAGAKEWLRLVWGTKQRPPWLGRGGIRASTVWAEVRGQQRSQWALQVKVGVTGQRGGLEGPGQAASRMWVRFSKGRLLCGLCTVDAPVWNGEPVQREMTVAPMRKTNKNSVAVVPSTICLPMSLPSEYTCFTWILEESFVSTLGNFLYLCKGNNFPMSEDTQMFFK